MKTLKTIGRMALVAFGLVLACPAMAQDEDLEAKFANREAKDPAPSDGTAWQGVKNLMLGWGSTDVRYSRSAVPAEKLAATVRLHAWRGERVSAQAVIVTPEKLTYSVQVSDLRKGSDVIPSSAVKTYEVGYVLGDCDMTHKDSPTRCTRWRTRRRSLRHRPHVRCGLTCACRRVPRPASIRAR